ncbi:uncharacterized protein LOC142220873 [Haematobia irritans]|uniref:uncharacterized protein LOC142220873 n=1 Tax=Haematobia irritans TaxID=7368 RepID=UPI003F4F9734
MGSYILALCLMAIYIAPHTMAASIFPAEIKRCHPGETDCIVRTANDLLRTHARKGFPAAFFPVVEPFHLRKVQLSDGHSGSLNLRFALRDVDVVGLSSVKFDRAVGFTPDAATSKFELYGNLPKLTIRSKYNADGRILILPIQGDGDADIGFENVKFSTKFKPAIHPKNGKTYLSVDKLKVLLEPQRMNIKLANLFNGDQALGNHMNQFLNENWSDVWLELQPAVQSTISDILKAILDNMFKEFAYEDFLDFCLKFHCSKLLAVKKLLTESNIVCLGTIPYHHDITIHQIFMSSTTWPTHFHEDLMNKQQMYKCYETYENLTKTVRILASLHATDPKPCKYDDAECVSKLIEYFMHEKSEGDSSINLIEIDPLDVKGIFIKQGSQSPVNIDLEFKNNKLTGLKDAKVQKIKGFGKDLQKKHEIVLIVPKLDLKGNYNVDGRILVLPISGTGTSHITLYNSALKIQFIGTSLEKDGSTYMKIQKFRLDFNPKGMHYKIDNLFNGDKILGDNMNLFLNENWEDIYRELKPSIESAFGKIFFSVIANVFTKYPYNKYFVE